MPSRRQVLAGFGTAIAVGLAGCAGSGSGGSDTTDCRSRAISHGDGNVLDGGAMARVEDEDVRVAIPLSVETVNSQDVDRLTMYDAAGEVAYVIPVSPNDADLMANKPGVGDGQLRYEQYLGHRPFHGRYEIVAMNRTGAQIDSLTVEFNCFPDISD